MNTKYDLANLTRDEYDYSEQYNEKSNYSTVKGNEEELNGLPPPEDDEFLNDKIIVG